MKVSLTSWAAKKFEKPPSLFTLRRMARDGEIIPAPVKVGREWLVEETAHLAAEAPSLVQRMQQGARA